MESSQPRFVLVALPKNQFMKWMVNPMDVAEARSRLAPCGLDCSRCADYEQGEIKEHSSRLLELLGNYQRLSMPMIK